MRNFPIRRRFRLIAMRHPNGRVTEHTLEQPIYPTIHVPIQMRTGFGQRVYTWNGRDHTVAGLPVYAYRTI